MATLTFNPNNEPIDLQNRGIKKPLFVPIKTQTSTPAYGETDERETTLSNFPSALSESTRKFTAGGFKGLFSKEPAPTWKEAGKQFAQSSKESMMTEMEIDGKKTKVFNPIAILSGEPLKNVGLKKLAPQAKNLTTKFLDYVQTKLTKDPNATLSRQEITDFAKRPELKKGEADLLNLKIKDFEGQKISGQDFADSIRRDLLELKPVKIKPNYYTSFGEGGYPDVPASYPFENIRIKEGNPKNYEEVVFESPITTNGSSHYPNSKKYFAHARGDEVVESGKKIWREQEIQSDLLQKEGLDKAFDQWSIMKGDENQIKIKARLGEKGFNDAMTARQVERTKLDSFTNDRFGERIMRERIKEKAQKGYSNYRLPTGETIGKIEGFQLNAFRIENSKLEGRGIMRDYEQLTSQNIKVGQQIFDTGRNDWIITDILGGGRFKAVPKQYEKYFKNTGKIYSSRQAEWKNEQMLNSVSETFDLTGKSNPQYRRYENWGKFLKNKFGGKEVIDPQGNSWIEIDLKKEYKDQPIPAFGQAQIKTLVGGAIATGAAVAAKPLFTSSKEISNYQAEKPKIKPIETKKEKYIGTNYDPYDVKQNRTDATTSDLGIGAAGIKIDETMVASSLKNDGITANLRLGTVIYIPELKKLFLVADLMNKRFNGMNKIDFATPHQIDTIIPERNKEFTIQIIREGKGREDARSFVQSGDWDRMKNETISQ